MASVNMCIVVGNLGKDPELRDLKNGGKVANFPVATSKKWKDKDGEMKEETTWHNITAFAKLAETCGTYLKKGSSVFVEGEMRVDSWEDDAGVKKYKNFIAANKVQFLTPKSAGGSAAPDGATEGEEIPF